jgi:hypothetical protein
MALPEHTGQQGRAADKHSAISSSWDTDGRPHTIAFPNNCDKNAKKTAFAMLHACTEQIQNRYTTGEFY